MLNRRTAAIILTLAGAPALRAGMTVYDLNDVVRLRLEDISFFAVLLLGSVLLIRFLWNVVARPVFPRSNSKMDNVRDGNSGLLSVANLLADRARNPCCLLSRSHALPDKNESMESALGRLERCPNRVSEPVGIGLK